jgi:cytochrome c
MKLMAMFLALAVVAPVHAQEGDPEAGADLYNSVCKGCHGVNIGPTLRGVVGRRVASVDSFQGYSAALKALGDRTWTPQLLDKFLQGPGELAPGTLMTQVVADARTRADLIAYLATLTPR